MSTTTKYTLTPSTWQEVTPTTSVVIIQALLGDLHVRVSTDNPPATAADAMRMYAGEKVDLTSRLASGDKVHIKAISAQSIAVVIKD